MMYDEKKEYYITISSWIYIISNAEKHRTHMEQVINIIYLHFNNKNNEIYQINVAKIYL